MSILFMLPNWEEGLYGWMDQMMTNLSSYLSAIAVINTNGEKLWNGKVPVISLKTPEKEIRYLTKFAKMLDVSIKHMGSEPERELKSILNNYPISQIFCQYGTFAEKFMSSWLETNIPLFVHFHGYDATFDLRLSDQPNIRRFSDNYLQNMIELSKRSTFISNSNFTKSILEENGISPDCIKVKYFGIPLPENPHMHEITTGIQILHLGRLVDFKSPDRTIQAFEIARSRGLDAHLILAGDGPLKPLCELLRMRSPYSDTIHILGHVNQREAQKLFATTDIFTAHNITGEITRQPECFGVTVIEAMAFGLPVVGTKHGGVLETVIPGETGILNEPGDVEAQADSFLQLSQNPNLRQKMGNAGRKRVAEKFNPEQEVEQLKNIMGLH